MRDRYKGTFEISTVYLPAGRLRCPIPTQACHGTPEDRERSAWVERAPKYDIDVPDHGQWRCGRSPSRDRAQHSCVWSPVNDAAKQPIPKSNTQVLISSHKISTPHPSSYPPHPQTRRVLSRSSTSEANTFSTTLITNFWHHFTIRGEVGNAKASVYHLESRNSPVAKTSYYPPIEPTPSQVSLQLYFT